MESNNRSRLSSFLSNRRTLIIISILLAIITWLAISINESPEVERTIKHVKVQVDESLPRQLGYEAFGADNLYVDVTVSGKRYEVGDNVLSANDIRVIAVTSYVDAPGKYTLQLRATSREPNADYRIVSKSSDYVDVYFDTPETVDVQLEPVVRRSHRLLYSNDYMTTDPVLSKTKLTLYGPSTQIARVAHAYAIVDTDGELKHSETQLAELRFVDTNGSKINYLTNESGNNVTLTIPVYEKTTMPLSVRFTGVPTSYIKELPSYTISPSTINAGVDPIKLRDLDSLSVGSIDYSELRPGKNTFTFDASDIKDGIALDQNQTYTVTVTVPDYSSRQLTVDLKNLKIQNVPGGFTVTPPSNTSITLTLYGPKKDLDKITPKNISLSADLRRQNIVAGQNSIPIRVTVNNNTCWSYGSHTAAVTAARE